MTLLTKAQIVVQLCCLFNEVVLMRKVVCVHVCLSVYVCVSALVYVCVSALV